MSIQELAKLASLSPFYYQRLFHRLVKKTVNEYIKLRRMAKACERLLDKEQRILDIAIELGFATHENFTRTFKNTFGLTPEEYRKNPIVLNYMTKPELLLNYVLVDEGVPLVTEGIVIEIHREQVEQEVCYAGYLKKLKVQYGADLGTESGEDVLYTLWEKLHMQKEQSGILLPDAEEVGVVLESDEPGYYSYFAGTRWNGKDHEDLVSGRLMAMQKQAKKWVKENKVKCDNRYTVEVYPKDTMEQEYPEMYLLLPVVK